LDQDQAQEHHIVSVDWSHTWRGVLALQRLAEAVGWLDAGAVWRDVEPWRAAAVSTPLQELAQEWLQMHTWQDGIPGCSQLDSGAAWWQPVQLADVGQVLLRLH
jgi:hypothetical protein